MKKTSLNNAKLRILELTEKYNKKNKNTSSTVNKRQKSSSDHSSSDENVNTEETGNIVIINNEEVHEPESGNTNILKLDIETNQNNNVTIPEDEDGELNSSILSKTDLSLSENRMSDIPNQFENIKFVSSSSSKSQSILDSSKNNLFSKFVDKDNIDFGHYNSEDKEISIQEIENISDLSDSNSKHFENNSLGEVKSVSGDIVTSTHKSNSIHTYGSSHQVIIDRENLSELNELSYKTKSKHSKSEPLESNRLGFKSVKQQKYTASKDPKTKTMSKGTTTTLSGWGNPVNMHVDECYQPIGPSHNNEITVCSDKKLQDNEYCRRPKDKLLEKELIKNKNESFKTGEISSAKKKVIYHNFTFRPSINQQPMIKSCKLLKFTELDSVDFDELLKKPNYLPLPVDIMPKPCINKADYYYEGLVTQLLRNQIQLTRHFIERHHQMYLHYCKTIKALNEKTTSNKHNIEELC